MAPRGLQSVCFFNCRAVVCPRENVGVHAPKGGYMSVGRHRECYFLSVLVVASVTVSAAQQAVAQRAASGYPPGLSVGTGGAYSGTGGAYGGHPPGLRSGTGGAYSGTGGAYGGHPPGLRSGTGGAYSGTGGAYGGHPPGLRSGTGGAYSGTGGAYPSAGGAHGGVPSNVRVGGQPGVSYVPPYAKSAPCAAPRPHLLATQQSRRAAAARVGRRVVRFSPLAVLGLLADYSEYVERGCL
jgi:hypothetical protein